LIIKSDYQYAELSIPDKQQDRFEVVVTQCNEFMDRFPDSKLKSNVQEYLTSAQNNLKTIRNEQTKKAS
jgi:outer membrane protein assembly factor BamD